MKPTQNRVLVRPNPAPTPVEGEEKPKGNAVMNGVVVDTGPKVEDIDKGSKVYFQPFGFDEVIVGEEKLVLIPEELIIAYE